MSVTSALFQGQYSSPFPEWEMMEKKGNDSRDTFFLSSSVTHFQHVNGIKKQGKGYFSRIKET